MKTPLTHNASSKIFFKKLTSIANHRTPACLLLMLLSFVSVMTTNAQVLPPEPSQRQSSVMPSKLKDESENNDTEVRPRVTDPAAIMRAAHFITVHSKTDFINEQEVEDSLRKRREFQLWGMALTRNDGEADLIIEITRKTFTRRFTFTVLDPRTMLVVTSGKTRSVIFGKKIANKVAEKFANRVKAVRPLGVATSNP